MPDLEWTDPARAEHFNAIAEKLGYSCRTHDGMEIVPTLHELYLCICNDKRIQPPGEAS